MDEQTASSARVCKVILVIRCSSEISGHWTGRLLISRSFFNRTKTMMENSHVLKDTMLHLLCNIRESNFKYIDTDYTHFIKNKRKRSLQQKHLVSYSTTFSRLTRHLHFCLCRSYARPICIFTTFLWLSIKHATWRVLLRVKATPFACAHPSALLGKFWDEPTSLHFLNHKLGASRDFFDPTRARGNHHFNAPHCGLYAQHVSPQLLLITCQKKEKSS